MLDEQAWRELGRHLKLSPREIEIARCILDDCKETAIASELGISPHTVRTHVERLYRKMGVRSRVEFVVRLVDEYLRLVREAGSRLPPICADHSAGRCPFRH